MSGHTVFMPTGEPGYPEPCMRRSVRLIQEFKQTGDLNVCLDSKQSVFT